MAARSIITQLRRPYAQVLGWWNKSLPGTTLGTLLIFLAECGLVTRLCNSATVDIAVNAVSHGISNLPTGEFRLWESNETQDAALSILNGIDIVDKIYLCGGTEGFQALSKSLIKTHLCWPEADRFDLPSTYDTTQYVQELWRNAGRFRLLAFQTDLHV